MHKDVNIPIVYVIPILQSNGIVNSAR